MPELETATALETRVLSRTERLIFRTEENRRELMAISDRVRRLVLLGPMGLPTWRATIGVLAPDRAIAAPAFAVAEASTGHLFELGVGRVQ